MLSAAMVLPMVLFNGEPVHAEGSTYSVITDSNGNPIDLGGMEIVVRDWWSVGNPGIPLNDYEEARQEYRDWIQETYNFTFKEQAISTWGDAPMDFVDYVMSGGDYHNYVFALRSDDVTANAFHEGLMYDLASLDCLDFEHDPIFIRNGVDELYSRGDSIYAMYASNNGFPEAMSGLYFNKALLLSAGIDPESIYDMQAAGTWTWDAWISMLDKVTRDENGDGTIDIYGLGGNYPDLLDEMVMSNGGSYITRESNRAYRIALEDPDTYEALKKSKELMDTYDVHLRYDNEAPWDIYKDEWKYGGFAFYYGQVWEAANVSETDFEVGFVSFPVGPGAGADYRTPGSEILSVIPACYDRERAWKIAFAYKLYYGDVPGYEDYIDSMQPLLFAYSVKFDDRRAAEESIPRIIASTDYRISDLIPRIKIGENFYYNIYSRGPEMDLVISGAKNEWQPLLDELNRKLGYSDTSRLNLAWNTVNGKSYWYENGVKQGTYDDPHGVMGDGTIRGREIFDPASGGWYWLDSCYDGAKAVDKEVWMPYIYQNEKEWDEATIRSIAYESDEGMGEFVMNSILSHTGKWVRYDSEGKMVKGWYTVTEDLAYLYPTQVGNTYYYDERTGLMAKGDIAIGGTLYHFDEITGALRK